MLVSEALSRGMSPDLPLKRFPRVGDLLRFRSEDSRDEAYITVQDATELHAINKLIPAHPMHFND